MTLSDLFTWTYLGQDSRALRDYQDDEQIYIAVNQFFNTIDGTSVWLLIISLTLPIAICLLYHLWFNNKPGRHYRPRFQLLFFAIAAVATFVMSLIIERLIVLVPDVESNLGVFLLLVSLGAMCFGMFVYVVTAILVGLTGKTNAYPLHKIFSKK